MTEEFNLSEKIKRLHIKAIMAETERWGTIPHIEYDDGSSCSESISHHLEIGDVKEFVRRLKIKMEELEPNEDVKAIDFIDKLAGDELSK